MDLSEYRTLSGGSKAAHYYNKHLQSGEPFSKGDSVKWTYVSGVPSTMPPTQVVGFRESSELEGFTIDTDTIIEKMVKKKIESTFSVLDWNINNAIGGARPKNYGW